MNTIYILWLRQLKRYFRSKPRIIGSLGQPLLFLVALGYGFGPVFQKAGEGNYIEFLAPGIISMSILFTAMFSGIEVIWDRQFGFLKATLVAPVSRFEIMIGKTIGGATVAIFQGIVVLLISFIAGFRIYNTAYLLITFLFMFLVAFLFAALGMTIASVLEDFQGFQLISNFLIMPLFFLSGALFPITGLPKIIGFVAKVNPLSYGIDGIRNSLIGISNFGFFTDFTVLFLVIVVLTAIGSYLFSKIQI
ncbi:MAG: multidrug ABC transporter permease [Candidatus Nealsonbacteria bacterium CG_4_10_14_0_2_um_filter_38_17]|uniref:Transport permease protein n=2 Tax=Candidatus Nealsoniibacteriota TaxID=1817911 RepID=A0A2M7UX19_9BACT|nr:MAG: multidrug ABC transporter permease [Candidatus Nealsonbacteria bacterium CG23_combo_of_CG06-09_8_20_14_all_38_19]PIZ88514.1 MAG: multidrug ABC transporter permease [Candidatus Nealsonbacteria bacterium CG_4_10_14_0_2_um_filter_38_17]